MEQEWWPFKTDEHGYTVIPPETPHYERLRAALRTRSDEPLRLLVLTDDHIHNSWALAHEGNPFCPQSGMVLRSDARCVSVTLPDRLVNDMDFDVWGYIQDAAERRTNRD